MLAYFLGGSWDRTKRNFREPLPPVWDVMIAPRLSLRTYPSNADCEAVENCKIERERYRRLRHDSEKDLAIYVFEENW